MAQKKNSEPKVQSEEEANVTVASTDKTEESAKKAAEGTNKKFKLADPSKSYSENNFSLVGDEEKELPEDPSAQLIERIRHGFIIEASK